MRSAIMFGVLGCSVALAQEPASPRERFVRDGAAIVLELDGPASLRSKFLATNLGTMLAAQDAGDLWTALRAPLERALRSIGEDSGARLTGLLDVLDTYRGRITLAIELTANEQAWAGISPDAAGVLILAPDGRADLGALRDGLAKALDGSTLLKRTVAVGEDRLPCYWFTKTTGISAPRVLDGHLVLFFGEQLERALGRAFGEPEGSPFPDLGRRRPSAFLRIDLARFVELSKETESWKVVGFDVDDLYRVTGLSSLVDLQIRVRPNGPHVEIETSVGFLEGRERGLFAALFPDASEPPGLIGLVPDGVRYWQAAKLDVRALHSTFARALGLFFDGGDDSGDWARDAMKEYYGFDPETEMLPYLGLDCLVLGRLFSDDDEAGTAAEPVERGLVFVFELKDSAAFERRWRQLIDVEFRTREPAVSRVADVKIETYDWWEPMSFAVSKKVFVIALGGDTNARVRAVVERQLELDPDDVAALPGPIRNVRRSAPPGFNGCGAFDVREMLAVEFLDLIGASDG